MRYQGLPPLWKHILRESIWSHRGIIKVSTLLLPISVILALEDPSQTSSGSFTALLAILLTVSCWILVSTLANDLTDAKEDRIAEKTRWINRLPVLLRAGVVLLLFGIGLSATLFSLDPITTAGVYVLALTIGFLYSVKPPRLKEHGIWGLPAYSLACALGYAVLPWSWLGGPWKWLLLMAPAVFLDKWTNLHFHQVIDLPSDLKGGIDTYAVRVGIDRARKTLRGAAALSSLASLVVLSALFQKLPEWRAAILLAAAGTVLGCGVYARLARRSPQNETSLTRELPWFYLGITYAVFRVLPLVLMIRLSMQNPNMRPAAALTIFILLIESLFFLRYRYA